MEVGAMNDAYKKLASGMLYLAVLALFLALATYFVSGVFGNVPKILLIVGGLLLVGYVVASPETVLGAVRSRGARYGGNTLAMSALVIVIIGAGNWFTNSHSQSFDMTRDRLHTLSPQTIDILKNLHQDVKVTAFFQTGTEQQAKDLLAEYGARSGYIQYRFVDPDKDPTTARQFGIVSYGTTVFQSGNNRKDVPSTDEQDYTSAILTVTSTERHKIYFVVGNGQPDPTTSSDQQGLHAALVELQNDNYVVGTLDATASAVPDDAAAVILTAGTKPLLDGQKAALSSYLAKGGKMLIASGGFAETDLNDVVKPFGLQFLAGITIDPAKFLQQGGPQMPAVSSYPARGSDLVKNLSFTVFPVADGIQVTSPPPQGITNTAVAQTSDQSWLQNHKDQAQFREGDTRGPINLVVTSEGTLPQPSAGASAAASAAPTPIGGLANPSVVATPPPASASAPAASAAASGSPQASAQPTQTPTPIPQVTGADVNLKGGTRIVAVADTVWLTDQFLDQVPGNHDLFLNAINYLVGNQALVNLPARSSAANSTVNLLGNDANLIFFVTVVFVPLAVLVIGGSVWWTRR
ncbi:MAG TPA: Gldg family protein [Chloroflexota bacterium]